MFSINSESKALEKLVIQSDKSSEWTYLAHSFRVIESFSSFNPLNSAHLGLKVIFFVKTLRSHIPQLAASITKFK